MEFKDVELGQLVQRRCTESINSRVHTFSAPPLDKLAELVLLVNIFKLHPLEILEFPKISTFLDFSGILRSFWRIEQLCRKIEQLCRKIPAEAWHKQMHKEMHCFLLMPRLCKDHLNR